MPCPPAVGLGKIRGPRFRCSGGGWLIEQDLRRVLAAAQRSIIHFHDTADENAPFEGGVGDQSIAQVDFASVRQTIESWVVFDHCPATPVIDRSGEIIHERYAPSDQGTAVELFTVIGGGHAWPGGQKPRGAADTPTQEISATRLSWAFFSAHPMP
jgi:polyhydroxybutyrate depolymerase